MFQTCVVQVEEVHAQVVEAVKSLYYKHRHLHNWQDRELDIVYYWLSHLCSQLDFAVKLVLVVQCVLLPTPSFNPLATLHWKSLTERNGTTIFCKQGCQLRHMSLDQQTKAALHSHVTVKDIDKTSDSTAYVVFECMASNVQL